MAMTSLLLNSATLLLQGAQQRFQQPEQGAVVATIASTVGADDVSTQRTQKNVDQVQLSQVARQAFAATQQAVKVGSFSTPSELNQPDKTADKGVATTNDIATDDVDNTAVGSAPVNSPIAAYQRQIASGQAVAKDDTATTDGKSSGKAGSVPNITGAGSDSLELSPEAQQKLMELAKRDQEVKVHEAAHAAVGGRYAGAPQLSYETGPDGKRYAVSGEVSIDVSEIKGDPAATMKKADIVYAAALAPAQPSAQDRLVAAKAAQMKTQARAELLAQNAAAATAIVERSHLPPAADTTAVPAPRIPSPAHSLSAYTVTTGGSGKTAPPDFSSVI